MDDLEKTLQDITKLTIFSQSLRSTLLNTDPPVVRSRRQLFRLYENVFCGRDLFLWSIKQTALHDDFQEEKNNNENSCSNDKTMNEITTDDLTMALQKLLEKGFIHSVHGDIPFKSDNSLYRFAGDDTMCNEKIEAFVKGYQLYQSTLCPNCTLLQRVCRFGVCLSNKCMRGSDLVTWSLQHNIATSLEATRKLFENFLKHNILKPVYSSESLPTSDFEDRRFYIFDVDFTEEPLTLKQFVRLAKESNDQPNVNKPLSEHARKPSGNLLDLSLLSDIKIKLSGRTKVSSISSNASDDSGFTDLNSYKTEISIKSNPSYDSLLNKDGSESVESLQHPEAPFYKKELRIYPDRVGYGFIIRGTGPCFVKIVDPDSPAGKAGLKAYQFISEINGRNVMHRPHVEIEDLILSGPKCLRIGLLCPAEDTEKYILMRMTATIPKELNQETSNTKNSDIPPVVSNVRKMSLPIKNLSPALPTAQPWMKRKMSSDYNHQIYY